MTDKENTSQSNRKVVVKKKRYFNPEKRRSVEADSATGAVEVLKSENTKQKGSK